MVEVIAAQRRVTTGGEHFEDALRKLEDRDIEGSATEVVDRVGAVGAMVQPIGDRGGGRLVEQAQDIDACQPSRVLGGLPLRVVEVGGNSDDCTDQIAAERLLRALAQDFQDLGRDFDRALNTGRGAQLQHARSIVGALDKVVRHVLDVLHIRACAPHEALDRHHGVARIQRLVLVRFIADLGRPVGQVAHDGGKHRASLGVVDDDRNAVAYGRHQGIGGSEVDADRQPMLVRGRRLARLGDLQQGHQADASRGRDRCSSAARTSSRNLSMNMSWRTSTDAAT